MVYVLRVCVGCAFCVLVLWCTVLYRYVWCGVCGVCVVCVVCVRCGVCGVCVCGAAWHAETSPVCRFQTPPCVRSKRFSVCRQNARMLNTCARFVGTHGGVLNVHTETFLNQHTGRKEGGFSSLSLFLSLFLLLSLFRRSLHSFSSTFSLLCSLSDNDNYRSSSWLSL